jgi:hypothetical protein
MPSTAEWLAAQPDALKFFANPANALSYANALTASSKQASDDQAQVAAGKAYGAGDYSTAATTLANTGNIADAQKVQQVGQANNSAGMAYIAKALPVFQKIGQLHAAEGPQAQAAALTGALDHLAPEAKQLTGVSDQTLMALHQSFATDPQGTLDRLQAMVPTEFKTVGDSLVPIQGNQILSNQAYTGMKTVTAGPGQTVLQVGGAAGSSPQAPPGTATPATPPAQSGADIFGGQLATPQTVATIESGNNPNAVSSAGAVGTMQTMPDTLRDPGYGVAPAQNNSPQEETRVGTELLSALGQKFGNPVDQLVAYNKGSGFAQKWIQQGRHFDQLPKETQLYLGRAAVAQLAGKQPPPLPSQAAPQARGASVLYQGGPVYRDATPEEAKKGIRQVNTATGEEKFAPANITMMQSGMGALSPAAKIQAAEQYLAGDKSVLQGLGYGTMGAANRAEVRNLIAQLAQQRGESASQVASRLATFDKGAQAFASGTQGNTIRALGVALSHLDVLRNLGQALNNGNVQAVNQLKNAFQAQFGKPAPANFDAAREIVGDEVVKSIVGNGAGAIADREAAKAAISKASSWPQLLGVIHTYQQLQAGQLMGLRSQYEASTGLKDFDNHLTPEARQVFSRFRGSPPAAQRRGAQPSPQDIVNELRRRGVVK